MKGNNALFRADPEGFLKTKRVNCRGVIINSNLQGDFAGIIDGTPMEFDLVPTTGNIVDLRLLGPVGTYGKTSRKGSPIVAHFLHWKGQTFEQGSDTFGCLNLSACNENFVFTAPFSGCNFVLTRSRDGIIKVYHEPTLNDRTAVYPDEVIAKIGPDYADGATGGTGVLYRSGGGWKAAVSSEYFNIKGARIGKSVTYDVP